MAASPQIAALPLGSLFGVLVLSFLVLGVMIWLWGGFLDVHEHNPARVRHAMMFILGLATVMECTFSLKELTLPWVAVVSLFVNFWGGLDALLRFPVAHDLESGFVFKQLFLVTAKTLGYALGMNGFRQHASSFFLILVIIIWGLPVLFLMAMPLDPREQVLADDECNVDILVKLWRLSSCQHARHRYRQGCRAWLHSSLSHASQKSPMAQMVLPAASPAYKKAFRDGRRCV